MAELTGVSGHGQVTPRAEESNAFVSFIAPAACGVLVLSLASDAAAQSRGERRSGWYIGGAIGASRASEIEQTGFNRDPLGISLKLNTDLGERER